nr:hypothetical protein [Tanacetum cinerariifolium]
MFDCDDYLSSKSDETWSPSSLYDRFQPSDGYHAVPPPYTRTFMPPTPNLVFNTTPTTVETDHFAFTIQLSPTKLDQDLSHPNRPSTPIIEDWVSNSKDEFETKAPKIVPSFVQSTEQVKSPRHSVQHVETSILVNTPKPVSAAVSNIKVTRPRHAKPIVTKTYSPIRKNLTCSLSPNVSNSPPRVTAVKVLVGNPQHALKDKGVINSGCSRHMIGNMSYLSDFKELNSAYVAFEGNPKGGKISGKGKIRIGKLDFDDVYFVKELKFNLFSVSQMCDKKNSVLFTDTECLVLSPDFKLSDASQMLLRVPRENNMYNVNLKNIVPSGYLTCLFAKAIIYESNLWHRRLGHINFKTMNKLVKGNLVRGLPTKVFKNDHTCVACKKDDYSGFTWVFFLATKDKTSPILKTFITGLENQLSLKLKVIRNDNGTEFKKNDINQFYGMKGIKREFSVPRTPQQNGIAERKNKTLIETARTMMADSLLPILFWAEAINTAYSLGKFDGKVDEGFLVGYSVSSKAFSVFNSSGPTWLFDIDSLIRTMNYHPIIARNQTNPSPGFQDKFAAEKAGEEINQQYVLFPVWSSGSTNLQNNDGDDAFDGKEPNFDAKKPESKVNVYLSSSAQSRKQDDKTKKEAKRKIPTVGQNSLNSTNTFSAVGPSNAAASPTYGKSLFIDASQLPDDPDMLELEDITYSDDEDDVSAEADFNNLETSITISLIPTIRVHKDHPEEVYVCQPPGFEDPDHPDKVYKVVKALYGLHQAPRAWYETLANYLLENGFQRGKSDSTPIDTEKPLLKDPDGEDVDVHTYRSMIGSTMYLTSSRPKIMFAIDFLAVQEETVVATLSTKAKYVAAASCCAQVLWIQNQLLDYSSIKYALTVNPNIYVSYIKQFWTTIAVKQVNDVTRLQALVDKKKIVITEATIRDALRLDDAEGVDCLPNEEIFVELDRMGYEKPSTKLTFYKAFFTSQWKFRIHTILQCMSGKRTSWNEFSSSMASIVICLSSDENVEDVNAGDAAYGDDNAAYGKVPTVIEEPSIPSLTPPTPSPQPPQDIPSISQDLEITKLKRRVKKLEKMNKVRVLKLRRLQKVGTSQGVESFDDTVMDDESNQGRMIAEMDQDDAIVLDDDKEEDREVVDAVKDVEEAKEDETEPAEVQEVVEVVTTAKLIYEVTAASDPITAASITIPVVAAQVPAVTVIAAPAKVVAATSRRRKGVVIKDHESESTISIIIPAETKSKDKGKGILIEEPKPFKKKQQIKQDEQYARELHTELNKDIDWDEVINHTESQPRKNMILYLKNVGGFKMDYFKGMSYDDIRPIFEAKFNSNVAFLQKTREEIEDEESRALKRINETPAERVAKRRKLYKEVEKLKRYLQIVPNKDDDVYTEATPLAQKVPIVDYQIIEINNKPYYKIIRADDTHQLYISFLTLLRNFEREDLEALWGLVKERFSTTKPKNFSDDFLLVTLGAMFEKPDIHAQI